MPDREDLLYEEELLRNPYSLRMWWRYLEDRKGSPLKKRFLLYERALSSLPGSYKACFAGVELFACYPKSVLTQAAIVWQIWLHPCNDLTPSLLCQTSLHRSPPGNCLVMMCAKGLHTTHLLAPCAAAAYLLPLTPLWFQLRHGR